jgi:hypothetical protein
MRIAITGTHGVGKTTLIGDAIAALPGYEAVPEPYWLLSDEGMAFADGAGIGDLEQQLARSCTLLLERATGPDLVFDRCPLDFLAYLDVVSAAEGFEWLPGGRLLGRIEKAVASLDRVVFVPLRQPDEIAVAIEQPKLRRRVDARLRAMLREDDLGLLAGGPGVVEIFGTPARRLSRLAALLKG